MLIRIGTAALIGLFFGVAGTAWYAAEQLTALEAKNAVLAEEVVNQKRAYAASVAASLALQAANLKLTAERDRHKQTVERQKESVARFSTSFAGRTTTRLTRELIAVPGRSAPLAGAAVNIGMFALTVAEACLTIAELNTMLREDGESELAIPTACGLRLPRSVTGQ